jgi:hypothetical protein
MVKERSYIAVASFLSFRNFGKMLKSLESQHPLPLAWFVYNDSGKPFKPKRAKFPIVIVPGVDNRAWYFKRLGVNLNYLFSKIPSRFLEEADYVFKFDDDTLFPNDYVERLIPFLRDGCFGCVSGRVESWNGFAWVREKRNSDYACGNGMLFRKEIIGYWRGFPTYPSSDTLVNYTANLLGFRTMQVNEIVFYQDRMEGSNSGLSLEVATAIKHYYLRFPTFMIWYSLLKRSAHRPIGNVKDYLRLKKEIKEEDRLNKPELLKVNNRRIIRAVLRKGRKYFDKWI